MPNLATNKIIFLLILMFAAIIRLIDVNWDQGQHLHPDERFLTMVGLDLNLPSSVESYFNPETSPLNPTNILDVQGNKKYPFFVYGTFPLITNKLLAILFNNNTYQGFTIQGRLLSAFFDILVVIFVYKTTELFEKHYKLDKRTKYFSAFFYAIAVLPIQLAHFFAVDSFLSFFMLAAFYYSLRFYFKQSFWHILISGILFGFGLASKVTAIFILPLILIFFVLPFINKIISSYTALNKKIVFIGIISITTAIFFLTSYISLRIGDPYVFESSNLFNPQPSKIFIENLNTLKSFESTEVLFPPAVQWLHKPAFIFALWNIAMFGLGVPFFILTLIGSVNFLAKKNKLLWLIIIWSVLFFVYQSTQFVKAMRYFIFLYPFFAIYAANGLITISKIRKQNFIQYPVLLITVIWPLCFLSIYMKPHSRVTASEWVYKNIPNGSKILYEYWDDALPLPLPYETNQYTVEQFNVFDPDTDEKWQKMNGQLQEADYYILSSNRGWGSITKVPERYPKMTNFYNDLFSNKLAYKKIKEINSYPSLRYMGIPFDFPDWWSDESFTVYDHPQIKIFKKI